jgi:hypothetical protein
MATTASEAKLKLIAENLARAALAEFKKDVQGTGTAATGASVGFGKMVFANGQLIASTATARRGAGLFNNALQQLTFQAAGIPGPVGKAASAIGLMGIGGGPVLIATAGIGALALGWNILTKDVTASTDAIKKFAEGLDAARTPGDQFKRLTADLRADLEQMDRRFVTGREIASGALPPGLGVLGEIGAATGRSIMASLRERSEREAVNAALALRGARIEQGETLIRQLAREADLVGKTAAETARLHAAELGLSADRTAALVAEATRLERRKEEVRVMAAQADLLAQLTDIHGVESFPVAA